MYHLRKAEKLRKVQAGAYQAKILGNQPYPSIASGTICKTSGSFGSFHLGVQFLVFPLIHT